MNITKTIYTLALMLFAISAFAQTPLITEYPNSYFEKTYGQNRTHYIHAYLDAQCLIGDPAGFNSDWTQMQMGAITFGIRYKLKLAKYLATGIDLHTTYTGIGVDQDGKEEGFTFPSVSEFTNESLEIWDLGSEAYLRIQYGRAGDRIGKFIDVGAFGKTIYSSSLKQKTKQLDGDNTANYGTVKTTYSDLNYIEPFVYGLSARIGFNYFVISGAYYLVDLFNVEGVDLPKYRIGIQVGFHK